MRAANGMVLYAFATPVLSKSKLSPWHDAVEISGAGALDLGEIQLAPSRMLLAAHLLAKRKGMYQVLMANVTVDEEKIWTKMLQAYSWTGLLPRGSTKQRSFFLGAAPWSTRIWKLSVSICAYTCGRITGGGAAA